MDLSELSSFVEAHPDDHEQRWRLAKKLYMSCQYRQALDHLLVLKSAWRPRVNVVRYLAATYYRLGRYDEALRELLPAIERWPDEIALREQVARVYEVTERYEAALAMWRDIGNANPAHPMAARALVRLEALSSDDAPEELPIGDSDSGIDIGGVVCAVCGAQNSLEFSRCWQCHALLDDRAAVATPAPATAAPEHSQPHEIRFQALVALALAAVALLSLDIYLTLDHFALVQSADPETLALTPKAFLKQEFAITRAVVGAALALVWPLSLVVAVKIVEPHRKGDGAACTVIGLLAASLAYACTWGPWPCVVAAPAVVALLTLISMPYFIPIGRAKTVAVWTIQGFVVTIAALAGFIAMEGAGPILDAVDLIRFARQTASDGEAGVFRAPDLLVNRDLHVRWEPSGSEWLDSQPLGVQFVLVDAPLTKPLYVELQQYGTVLTGRNVDSTRTSFTESPIQPGQDYVVRLNGPDDTPPVTMRVHSLLRPVFSQ